jgi:hypothetical protein
MNRNAYIDLEPGETPPGPWSVKWGRGTNAAGELHVGFCGKRLTSPYGEHAPIDRQQAWLEGFAAGVKAAAAPDLLEACYAALAYLSGYTDSIKAERLTRTIEAAIAKAQGGAL